MVWSGAKILVRPAGYRKVRAIMGPNRYRPKLRLGRYGALASMVSNSSRQRFLSA